MSDVRILITGGSGFIGTTAVNQAIARGWSVKNIDIKPPNESKHTFCWERVDITDRDAFIAAIGEYMPTHILHLAARTGMDLRSMDELTANTDGVKNLIEGVSLLSTLPRVLFTSSLLVCRNGYIPRDEDDYCPPNLYGKSKMIGEQIVKDSDAHFEWVIVRPTSIWGPWFEHSYKTFFQVISRGLYFHPGKDDQVKPKSYVGNTVHMMLALLLAPKDDVNHRVFYLSDWPPGTTREWAETINTLLGRGRIRTIPLAFLRIAALAGDGLRLFGLEPPISSFRLRNMLTGGSYSTTATELVVGKLPFSLEDGCRETISWMRSSRLI